MSRALWVDVKVNVCVYMCVLGESPLKVKVAQSCPNLSDPVDQIAHGILQARILEWVSFPSPEDLPNPGIEPRFPALQADSLPAQPQGKPKLRNWSS